MTLLKMILLLCLFLILICSSLSIEYKSTIDEKITVILVTDDQRKELTLPKGSTYQTLNNYVDLNEYDKTYQDNFLLTDGAVIELKKVVKGPISINKADSLELATLPGIGTKTAEKIVEFRKNHGSFEKLEELMLVPGIKEGKYEKLKEYISL